jgi:hypothetical protein
MLALSSEAGLDQINYVEVEIDRGADTRFYQYLLPDPDKLPGTLAIELDPNGDAKADEPIKITVQAKGPDDGDVKVTRVVRIAFAEEKTKFLSVPIRFACFGSSDASFCGFDETCTNGACHSVDVDVNTLPDFVDGYWKGAKGSSACFEPTECLSAADPAHSVSVSTALLSTIWKKPGSCEVNIKSGVAGLSALGGFDRAHINVGIHWPTDPAAGHLTVLDQASEGWTFNGDSIIFEAELCKKLRDEVAGSADVTIAFTDLCKTKTPLVPICSN